MLVKLKRNLYMANQRFRAHPAGTEIPDLLDGLPVVPWAPGVTNDGTHYVLPRDAEILSEKLEVPSTKPTPMALSQMPKPARSRGAVAADIEE